MNTLVWHLRQWARGLGASGLLGLGLLAAAALLQIIQVTSLHQSNLMRQDTLSTLRLAADTPTIEAEPIALNPLSALPPTGTAAQQIGELEQFAHRHGLDLPRGQYSVTTLADTSLQRWQLVLPVDATYPALLAFIATALERLPNLTLDEFKLERDRINTDVLQAELRMSLFVEAAP